jgi:hypothetical protein
MGVVDADDGKANACHGCLPFEDGSASTVR